MVAGIWEREERLSVPAAIDWTEGAGPLSPIVPVLLYTGQKPWESPADLSRLVKGGGKFARFVPAHEVLVLDLKGDSPFHRRPEEEQDGLFEQIECTLDRRRRKDSTNMKGTLAERLRTEGREEGSVQTLQDVLLKQLAQKFGPVPGPMEERIRSTRDPTVLAGWTERVIPAATLDDVGIDPAG